MSNELQVSNGGQASLVPLIQHALSADVDPAKLSALLQVRREWEADEARKAFSKSITQFQQRAPIIPKSDKAYDKEYARMDRIWRTIRPLLTELGLSVTWQVCELREGLCHVEGMLRHGDGHGERLVQDIPLPELIKGQNKAQQMGSASSYAKRYALCSALGIVTGEDDDGHRAGGAFISDEQAQYLRELVRETQSDEARFLRFAKANAYEEIPVELYEKCAALLHGKQNRR